MPVKFISDRSASYEPELPLVLRLKSTDAQNMNTDAQITSIIDDAPNRRKPASLYFIGPFILLYIIDGKTKTSICVTKTNRKVLAENSPPGFMKDAANIRMYMTRQKNGVIW